MTSHDHHSHDHQPTEYDQAYWDTFYNERPAIWSGQPNPQLVAEVADLTPGSALDVGSGEGADAIWLARQGWTVTAVDISQVALTRGAAIAAADEESAARITWDRQDLLRWAPPESSFNLISAQFMHLPKAEREPLFTRLAAAVAPGGTLLIVGHHPTDMESGAHRPPRADLFYTAEEIAHLLDPGQWEIVTESRERVQNHDGEAFTIHDAVLSARRTA
ncbi:class I SAM-dependent methyltransferase [Arthrobacter sp. 260]|uniref:SAM-dependent methyltransferase n=1 Tax=Arthrobacter sp. 260 TaxID=2735314 RepID=UPI00149134ED|nr:class I SAM-dependent methyltransferase [Arthrobacter sp. 260]NOJ60027.1 class I SAM-dependent methyltransferase [Arthrobacter sp. 260]